MRQEDETSQDVEYERRGPIAHLRLNRPRKLNALDGKCLDLLQDGIERAEQDDDVRAVVLSGRGRGFCAGADLALVADLAGDQQRFDEFLRRWHAVFGRVERSTKVTIGAVHGFALAGGFELTQVCDLLVMGQGATIGDQHAKYGLFPGGGSSQRLPRLVGKRRALWMLLSGEAVDADTALRMGLANEVVRDDDVLARAERIALMLAELSTAAAAAIKRSARLGSDLPLAGALDVERQLAVEHMSSADARTGLDAFQQRTAPDFGFRRTASRE